MSLWKFNDFEQELDFTDADFIEKIEAAKEQMDKDLKAVPADGKVSAILRAQIKVYDNYFDHLFGKDAHLRIFKKNSLAERIGASVSLKQCEDAQAEAFNKESAKYQVNKGNRAQRRTKQKNVRKGQYHN